MSARIQPSCGFVIVKHSYRDTVGSVKNCMLFVYRVLYAFKVLTPTCGTVSFPL